MKSFGFIMLATLALPGLVACSKESVGEKIVVTGNDAARGVKKAANRVEEAVCMEGDLKCAAEKAGNRIDEAAEATVDGAKELKNKVD